MKKQEISRLFPAEIKRAIENADIRMEELYEIRLRVNAPLLLVYRGTEYFLSKDGKISRDERDVWNIKAEELRETMQYISKYSMYAFEDEIKQGFITIQGGHRVGIAGKTILEGTKVKGLKYISYINLRLSHQIKGCADAVMPYIIKQGHACHTLIISPPRCGKTTLLRDMIRQFSDGTNGIEGKSVGVVDERSEIAGSYQGIPQNDLGMRTDILDCCPKAEGMMMLVRSMSPDIIAVDELGDYEDIHAIESVVNCGCKLFATVHGSSIDDIKRKPLMQRMIQERIFERYVLLCKTDRAGRVKAIFDERGTCMFDACKEVIVSC